MTVTGSSCKDHNLGENGSRFGWGGSLNDWEAGSTRQPALKMDEATVATATGSLSAATAVRLSSDRPGFSRVVVAWLTGL